MKNSIEIDWTDNPDLAAVFKDKNVGGKFELKITGQINELDEACMKGSIERVTVAKTEVEPETDDPVMVVIRAKSEEPMPMEDMGEDTGE